MVCHGRSCPAVLFFARGCMPEHKRTRPGKTGRGTPRVRAFSLSARNDSTEGPTMRSTILVAILACGVLAASAAAEESKPAAPAAAPSAPAATSAPALPNPFYAMDTCTKVPYPKNDITPEAQLDLVKELGYAGLCWTVDDPAQTKAVAEAAAKRGLKMFAIYVGATLTKDGLTCDARLADTMAALEGHGTLIWLHIDSKDFAKSSPDGDAVAVPALQKIADQAAARGLRVAIYPHVNNWTERVQDIVRVVKKVDRKNFGVTFNLCHCLRVGDEEKIPALLDEAAPHLFMVTINGADAKVTEPGWGRLIMTLDQGTFDVAGVLAKLKAVGYTGPIGLQGYGLKTDRRENLVRSMEGWRRISAKAAK